MGIYKLCRFRAVQPQVPQVAHKRDYFPDYQQNGPDGWAARRAGERIRTSGQGHRRRLLMGHRRSLPMGYRRKLLMGHGRRLLIGHPREGLRNPRLEFRFMIEVLDDALGDPRHVELNIRLHRDV